MFYRTLALLFLTLPLIAQDRSPFRRVPHFPPEIISDDVYILDAAKLEQQFLGAFVADAGDTAELR